MPETLLRQYLRSLREDHASGEAAVEVSGYGALQTLLNSTGERLSPRVRAVVNPRDRGAGTPDGGLFTSDQFRRDERDRNHWPAQLPARGAVEVKGLREDVEEIAASEQVGRYLDRYGQVLVTNYRDFLLVGKDTGDAVELIERYELAPNEREFWRLAANRELAEEHSAPFGEFLTRVLAHGSPIRRSRDLAWFLASYARESLARLDARPAEAETRALGTVRTALEEALGIGFEGPRGEHFFRSTLVQTLFYGVFSAWVLWSKQTQYDSAERFDWRLAAYTLNVPLIGALFEQLTLRSTMEALGLREVMNRTGELLNRVERRPFFEDFEEEGAVQYFYEPFLEAFDPDLRKQFGVWYTPKEVVCYMVERADSVLREELGIADGLADERVCVLDPCMGTGSFLVEVLKRIYRTLEDNGEDALAGQDLKRAATKRIFGFELLPAPFVVAHLQIGLLLQNVGAPLSEERQERAGVYLTNALSGWEQPNEDKHRLPLPEFEEEREAAESVKREKQILVVIGNPPYDGFAGVAVDEERDLSTAYRETRLVPKPKGQGLNNLYVRFFRMAERKIVEGTGKGVVCFISQYSWLDGLSYPGMRERYLNVFDKAWIDCLNGDSYKTGKVAPDGRHDPSIFSTETNPQGIQVGTAIALLVRKDVHEPAGESGIHFRHLWGPRKREELLATAKQDSGTFYERVKPSLPLGLPFMPSAASGTYAAWRSLPELFPTFFPGVKTSRDPMVTDIDLDRLQKRIRCYFDPATTHEEMRGICPEVMESTKTFDAEATRDRLRSRGLLVENFVRYCYRPFDVRWLYWEPETKLLDRNRADYIPHTFAGNLWIEARQRQPKDRFDRGYVTSVLADNFGNGLSSYFPLYLKGDTPRGSLFEDDASVTNLSKEAKAYLADLDARPEHLFHHAIALLHSPAYRDEHAGALRQDWPRLVLPADRETLERSASLGRQVSALLDVEGPVAGVTAGTVRDELKMLAVISRVGGGSLDPAKSHLKLAAGWGYKGHAGQTMAGQGRAVERDYRADERVAIAQGVAALGLSPEEGFSQLGHSTYDVYLNEEACWKNVPARVWEFTSGGYRVVKKWLSYREERVLGRDLEVEEVREVGRIVRRIATILLMGPTLDANYRSITSTGLDDRL